jgi:hypothetical protein
MRCAVRFWSSEFFCIFVFIIFFFALCVLGLSPFTKKPAEPGGQRRSPSGGTAPGPRLDKQAGEGDRQENDAKNGFENITKRGAGSRTLVSQPESRCGFSAE